MEFGFFAPLTWAVSKRHASMACDMQAKPGDHLGLNLRALFKVFVLLGNGTASLSMKHALVTDRS